MTRIAFQHTHGEPDAHIEDRDDRPRRRPIHDHLCGLPRRWQPLAVPRVSRPQVPRRFRRVAREVPQPLQGSRRPAPLSQLGRRDAQLPAGGGRDRRRGRLPQHGAPDYGNVPFQMLLYINEVMFYSQRPLVHFILGGVFERFPKLRFVITETGCDWVPGLLERLDRTIDQIRTTGQTGEIRYESGNKLEHLATEYFARNCYMGVSQPGPSDVAVRHVLGADRFMWGSDYPHDEGTYPFTREHLRQVFSDVA